MEYHHRVTIARKTWVTNRKCTLTRRTIQTLLYRYRDLRPNLLSRMFVRGKNIVRSSLVLWLFTKVCDLLFSKPSGSYIAKFGQAFTRKSRFNAWHTRSWNKELLSPTGGGKLASKQLSSFGCNYVARQALSTWESCEKCFLASKFFSQVEGFSLTIHTWQICRPFP